MKMFGYPDKLLVEWGAEPDRPVSQDLHARCRKCPPCLRYRSRLWTARAMDEIRASPRTWFGTLTVNPQERFKAKLNAAHQAAATWCEPWASIEADDQYKFLVGQLGPEVTKMLKRIRKNSGARLRYLLVSEAHKDGFPHFHLLLHEVEGKTTSRMLDDAWRIGFSQWRVVQDTNAAVYVCKYLSKSALTRVRASQDYGHKGHCARRLTESLLDATECLVGASFGRTTTPVQREDNHSHTPTMNLSPP